MILRVIVLRLTFTCKDGTLLLLAFFLLGGAETTLFLRGFEADRLGRGGLAAVTDLVGDAFTDAHHVKVVAGQAVAHHACILGVKVVGHGDRAGLLLLGLLVLCLQVSQNVVMLWWRRLLVLFG